MGKKLLAGVAVVTTVKDRAEPLRYSLASWLDCPEVDQIVIIDWGSKKPLVQTLAEMEIPGYPDPRIVIGRVEADYWQSSKALNLALSYYVERETCVKLDADVVIVNEEIFKLDPAKLHVGHWSDSTKLNRNYLTGSFVTSTRNLWNVGGYDQRLAKSYGFEDCDLYERLEKKGVERAKMPLHYLYHLPHRDNKRFENFEDPDLSIKEKWIQKESLEKWTRVDSAKTHYRHEKVTDGYYRSAEKEGGTVGTVLLNRLSSLGVRACELCIETAREMDRLGPDGCELNFYSLVDQIRENSKRVGGWVGFVSRISGVLTIDTPAVKKLLRESIEQARKDYALQCKE